MKVNINDYLDHDEMKEIAVNEFKQMVRGAFKKEKDIERVITNAAYGTIYKTVDELLGADSKELLAKKIETNINKFTAFSLFNKPNAWDRETNHAYDYLQQCIGDNYQNIKDVVEREIEPEVIKEIKDSIPDIVKDCVIDLLADRSKSNE